MAGGRIVASEISSEVEAHNACLEQRVSDVSAVCRTVEKYFSYIYNGNLSGISYNGSKEYFETYLLPLYSGIILACGETKAANSQVAGCLGILGEYGDIKVAETTQLMEEKQREEYNCNAEADSLSNRPMNAVEEIVGWGFRMGVIMMLRARAEAAAEIVIKCKDKLARVNQFEAATANLHSGANSVWARVESLANALVGVSFDTENFIYIIPMSVKDQVLALSIAQQELYSTTLKQLRDEDGSCNWEEIEKVMSKDAGSISPTEYTVLAVLYDTMEPEEIERFFSLCGTPAGPVWSYKESGEINGMKLEVKSWEPDQEKMALFMEYYQYIVQDNLINGVQLQSMDLEQAYADKYYDGDVDKIPKTIDLISASKEVIGEYNQSYKNGCQRFILLHTFTGIGSIYKDDEDPELIIERDADNNYCIKKRNYTNIRAAATIAMVGMNFVEGERYTIFEIDTCLVGDERAGVVSDALEAWGIERFGYTNAEIIGGRAWDVSRDFMLEQVWSKVTTGTAIGASTLPVVPIAVATVDAVAEKIEKEQDLKDVNEIIDNSKLSVYCSKYELVSVNVKSPGDLVGTMHIFPSIATYTILNELNIYLSKNPTTDGAGKLIEEVTVEDLLNQENYEMYSDLTAHIYQKDGTAYDDIFVIIGDH